MGAVRGRARWQPEKGHCEPQERPQQSGPNPGHPIEPLQAAEGATRDSDSATIVLASDARSGAAGRFRPRGARSRSTTSPGCAAAGRGRRPIAGAERRGHVKRSAGREGDTSPGGRSGRPSQVRGPCAADGEAHQQAAPLDVRAACWERRLRAPGINDPRTRPTSSLDPPCPDSRPTITTPARLPAPSPRRPPPAATGR